MKIFLMGARGMLAADIRAVLSNEHDIITADIDELDITDFHAVKHAFNQAAPELIINCAAYTNVDACETDIDNAFKVNALGPRNLAAAAYDINAPVVHFSTDYVFDGKANAPYTEFAPVNPLSIYGKSKLAGEEYIKTLTNRFYIIRTQWLYGKNGGNFVKTIINRAKQDGKLKVVNDQTGCPTYTKDLSLAVKNIINTGCFGTYHVTNQGAVSWYDFTREILKQSGLENTTKLTACTTAEFVRPAQRPAFAPLDNYCLKLSGLPLLRGFDAALADFFTEVNI